MGFHIVIFITLVGFVAGTLEHQTDLGGYIFMEPFLFLALDYFMEVSGWGSLTSSWLDDYACWFGGLLTCACLVVRPWLHIDGNRTCNLIMVWFWYTCLYWRCYSLLMDDGSSPPKGLEDGVGR
jgi:hypothetical protein